MNIEVRDRLDHNFQEQLVLLIMLFIALILRIAIIGKYGLSEDELLKIAAVRDYQNFSFSTNAQHPALMKIFLTFSVMIFGESEFALRLPNAIIASFTVYPIYYLGKELYNKLTGYSSALLWAVNIPSIAFSTTAKEDAFFTFFWILAIYYTVRSQKDPRYYKVTGIFIGLTMATKYMGVILVILIFGLIVVLKRTEAKDILLVKKIKLMFIYSIIPFLIFNFPLLIPKTLSNLFNHWILQEKTLPSRHGFIMMGHLFNDRPLYYLFLFIFVKISIPNIIAISLGIIQFIRKPSISNHIITLWIMIPFILFSLISGYTRYLLVIMPALLILASIGIIYLFETLTPLLRTKFFVKVPKPHIISSIFVIFISLNSIFAGLAISPYYRMYVNEIGDGNEKGGYYFPQDSVYDFEYKEAIEFINEQSALGSIIATQITIVAEYYGRSDLKFMYILNLPENITEWKTLGVSYVIIQESRIYLENQVQIENIRNTIEPIKVFTIMDNDVVEVYNLTDL